MLNATGINQDAAGPPPTACALALQWITKTGREIMPCDEKLRSPRMCIACFKPLTTFPCALNKSFAEMSSCLRQAHCIAHRVCRFVRRDNERGRLLKRFPPTDLPNVRERKLIDSWKQNNKGTWVPREVGRSPTV